MSRRSTCNIVVAMLGIFVGFALPAGGCSTSGPCPEYAAEGNYLIDAGYYREDWVDGSARVEVTTASIVISYTTTDGSRWEVEYERTATYD